MDLARYAIEEKTPESLALVRAVSAASQAAIRYISNDAIEQEVAELRRQVLGMLEASRFGQRLPPTRRLELPDDEPN